MSGPATIEQRQAAAGAEPRRPTVASRSHRTLRLGLFGCPLDTGNAGVSALGLSTLRGLATTGANLEVTLFDYGRGERPLGSEIAPPGVPVVRVGCYNSRRYYRTDNLSQVLASARLGLSGLQPMARRIRGLDAVLDISGGDSFADLYGARRFRDITLPKLVAIALGVPLILLPQTYGPYRNPSARTCAAGVLARARQVWARDAISLGVARDLLGSAFDPLAHRAGVDVAFGLPARPPTTGTIAAELQAARLSGRLLAGLNISGLLYNQPGEDVSRYGFRSPYRPMIESLLNSLLAMESVQVVLVPHVAPVRPMADCDATACREVERWLGRRGRDRVIVVPASLAADELKWSVGQCDWFCGTRMHSCIAGISQGIPTTAIAYSDKTLGVFDTAGVGSCVVDPRSLDGENVVRRVLAGLAGRDESRRALAAQLPAVRATLDEQFRAIIAGVTP